jgi:hypothetical protein
MTLGRPVPYRQINGDHKAGRPSDPLTKSQMSKHPVQGWQGSNLALAEKQVTKRVGSAAITDRNAYPFLFTQMALGLPGKANAMTITEKMISNLSCMFTMYGSHPQTWGKIDPANRCNYDAIEANGTILHSLPSLELPSSKYESFPESYKEALKDQAYKALRRVMTPSGTEVAIAAKQARQSLTLDAIEAKDTANRPDTIPSDLNVIRVTSWEDEKQVFIPAKSPRDSSLKELVASNTKPDGFMLSIPERPIGTIIGTISAEAWRKGQASSIGVHAPQPLPAYKTPQRDMTEGEKQVAEWLAQPGRKVTTSKQTDRLNKLMARFWDHGDGHTGLQPVMPENAAMRALGRIAKAQRANEVAA